MYLYDIVYIKGNPNSGTLSQHEKMNNTVLDLLVDYKVEVIDSEQSNKNKIKEIPKAKIYIGFSRGSRYLKKLSKDALRISIGGVSSSSIIVFTNKEDHILKGDISDTSLNAHFIIEEEHKKSIKKLIIDFLEN